MAAIFRTEFATKSATARIFGVSPTDVKEVKVSENVAWVHIVGKAPQFVSKARFTEDAVEARTLKALELSVHKRNAYTYRVSGGETVQTVSYTETYGWQCTCPDHERFPELGCKHRRAVQYYRYPEKRAKVQA